MSFNRAAGLAVSHSSNLLGPRARGIALTSLALLSLSGCLSFHSTPAPEQPLTFEPGSAQCLSTASVILTDLIEGHGEASRLNGLFDCARDSLNLFAKNVRGANASVYAPTELRSFMQKYFLGGAVISDPLLQQSMIVKTVFLGGATGTITRAEITGALSLIETTRHEALRLLPWFPLTAEHLQTLSSDDFTAATAAIQTSAQTFAGVLQAVGHRYPFADLGSFIDALVPVLDSSDARASLGSLRNYLPGGATHPGGIMDAKRVFAAVDPDAVAGSQWQSLIGDASRAYVLWLQFWKVLQQTDAFTYGPGRERFVATTRQILAFLDTVVSRHPDGLSIETLDQLMDDWLPMSINVAGFPIELETIKKTLPPVLSRILTGDTFDASGHRILGNGITHATVSRVEQYLTEWNASQIYIETAFDSSGLGGEVAGTQAISRGILPSLFTAVPGSAALGGASGEEASPTATWAIQRIDELIQAPQTWPLFAPDDNEVQFPSPMTDRHHSLNDLTSLNWMSQLAFALYRGYVDDPTRMPPQNGPLGPAISLSGATTSEVVQFYQDFKPFGVEIKLFDPDDDQTPISRFSDANLFLYASNGDDLLSPIEGQELLAFMVSADILSARFHNALVEVCPNGPLDIYDVITVDAPCYRKTLFSRRNEFFRNMPGLLRYYATLSVEQATDFETMLEGAARRGGYSNAMFGQDDAQRMAAMLQYIEALFARYDLNGDGQIDKTEAEAAYPVVQSRLAKVSCITNPSELHAVYTYLLKNGTPPTKGFVGDVEFLGWWATEKAQKYSADRMRILQIFSQLGKQLDAAKPCPSK